MAIQLSISLEGRICLRAAPEVGRGYQEGGEGNCAAKPLAATGQSAGGRG